MKKVFLIFIYILLITGCRNRNINQPSERILNFSDQRKVLNYGKTLSLDEAIKISKERNLDLKVKKLEREIASLDKKIAFGNFLPSLNIIGNYTQFNDEIDLDVDIREMSSVANGILGGSGIKLPNTMSSRFIDKSLYSLGVSVQIPIFVPSTWYLYAARQKGEKISELAENLASKMLQLEVMSQYYYILALESEKNSLENEINSAKEIERKVNTSVRVGAILHWELEKSQAFTKLKEFALNENERDLKIAKMNLLKTLNLDPMSYKELVLKDEMIYLEKLPTLEDCIYEAITGNDILKITETGKNISTDVKKIAITNFLPKIILGGGYINSNSKILSDPDFLYGNVSGIISIFNGFKNINEYKKAIRREKIAELKLEKEFMTVVIETTKAYQNVKKAEEIRCITELNFKGEVGKIQQKNSERKVGIISDEEYFSAISSYEKALSMKKKADFQYELALSALKIAMGKEPFKGENK